MTVRVDRQIDFLTQIDALKTISRANVLMDGSRFENTAEHSWHLALWVLVMADQSPNGVDIDRAIAMALTHDIVEVDAGDHPIHLPQDAARIAELEQAAAQRLFGLLPDDQGAVLHGLWQEFEAGETATARFVRMLDMTQPSYQELMNPGLTEADRDICREILTTGRAGALADLWPPVHAHLMGMLNRAPTPLPDTLAARVRFLAEADRLKSVNRATTLFDGSRAENSGEHSWHVAMFAMTLSEHASQPVNAGRVIRMLLLHDLVEIDAGDVPVHSAAARDPAAQVAAESRAADRLFGLLPPVEGAALRAIWEDFEAAETPEARFGKAIDRVQPVIANLETGGGTWPTYHVTLDQLDQRVGAKVRRGAPAVWTALTPRIADWFAQNAAAQV